VSVEALTCPKCGAPLPLPLGATAAICRFCNAALRVHTEDEEPNDVASPAAASTSSPKISEDATIAIVTAHPASAQRVAFYFAIGSIALVGLLGSGLKKFFGWFQDAPYDFLVTIGTSAAAVLCLVSSLYYLDRRLHVGAGFFERWRVRLFGVRAEATVLANEEVIDTATPAYSLIYEVRPTGQDVFRARGVEDVFTGTSWLYVVLLKASEVVHVRCDPKNKTVVLVAPKNFEKMREQQEALEKAKEEAEQQARERELLGGGKS
jgi:hypothetical protein